MPGGAWHDRRVEPTPSYPRLSARTLRFTLGEPRTVTVTDDGSRVLFVRTPSGTDRTGALWSFDVSARTERMVADPATLLGAPGEDLSAEERARRERARESGAGIVGYSVDDAGATAAFALSGRVWVCDIETGTSRELPTLGAAVDPRIDPTGRRIGYAAGDALRVVNVDGTGDMVLAGPGDGWSDKLPPDAPHHAGEPQERSNDESEPEAGMPPRARHGRAAEIVWGQAEFVAAEEMDRYRGFWWSPDGESLLAERYDTTPVRTWYIADPANPDREPIAHRYPAAGTDNVSVQLWLLDLAGSGQRIQWDDARFPYLTRVSWTGNGDPVLQVMSRDQRRAQVLAVDVAGGVRMVAEQEDRDWVDLVVGVPTVGPGNRLITCVDSQDTRRIAVDGNAVSPAGMQVRAVLGTDDSGVLATVSTDPTSQWLVRIGYDGSVQQLSGTEGVHGGASAAGTDALISTDLTGVGTTVTIRRKGIEIGTLHSDAVAPGFVPQVALLRTGDRQLCTAVLFPNGHVRGSARLPVLMAPYGGPHGQLVRQSGRMFLQSQWLADQGFAVIVADGRGTPGRGPAWERAVRDNLADVTLADQVDALAATAEQFPDDIDTDRVGILGWSYGGYLAALAVLDRPDVFHAAVAGAPVTDWRLYDTFYTERYLGHPEQQPGVYEANSLIGRAGRLSRPLMIIHGLVDDNVVVAHSLRLSAALLSAGRAHCVLPLTGVTHMASQEEVAENLLLLQVDFLKRSLGAVG